MYSVNVISGNSTDCGYSLQPILLFINMDVFIIKIYLNTSIFTKSNMGRREYMFSFFLNLFLVQVLSSVH
jgi:hypothetical protein